MSKIDETLQRFFDKIEFSETDAFINASIVKVVVNKEKETWDVYLKSDEVLPPEPAEKLVSVCKKGLADVSKINLVFLYEEIKEEDILIYFRRYIEILTKKNPSLVSLIDSDINVNEKLITIDVASKIEASLIADNSKKIIKWLDTLGISGYSIEAKINDEKRAKIKKEIEDTKEIVIIKEEPEFKVIIGEPIKSKPSLITDIIGEENSVTLEALLFGMEEFKSSKSNFQILTLKISDGTDSILAKIFSKDEEEFKIWKKGLKVGNWYRFRGYTKNDTFARDLVLNLRDVEEIPSKETKRKDNAEIKRVELHAHTKMSQMDSVVSAKDLLAQATKWGHKAIAITDHNGVQSFPEIHKFLSGYNKDKEDNDKFKAIYGVELIMVDDTINIIRNARSSDLMGSTYCVFDLETTGFNAAGGDSIIEIGAVLMRDGEIIDTFSELVDPGRKLPPKITEITKITDAMLKGKDNEENAVKRFKEWFKDSIMVAQNAKFDCSFIEMAFSKYGLGEFKNPVIDTMEISRALEPDAFRHGLAALVKRYEVEFDEEGHHRADYDAEATAKVLMKMLLRIKAMGISDIENLNNLVSEDMIHRFGRPFHVNLLAKNRIGLKNMFKLISHASTKYFYKTARILRSELEKHREGLLVGSGCYESEVFIQAKSKTEEELAHIVNFYDYVEIQPIDAYTHLVQQTDFSSDLDLQHHLEKIVDVVMHTSKILIATGDVHQLNPEDKIYREIIVNQKVPGGGRHPLARNNITSIPSLYFRTTDEMLEVFNFLGEEIARQIVIENPNKIADMIDFVDVIIDTKGVPYSPKIKDSDKIVREMVDQRAHELYGEKLHPILTERIESELKGIIGGGYDVIYLISQKLVKRSNDNGYLVGSRGSVGSSFVAFLMGITEVNALPAHYICPKCKYTQFEDEQGELLGKRYSSGYDLPHQDCPKCGEVLNKEGQDTPFACFLGFNADKVPDIDLNFSGEYQAEAHEYTKELFGVDNVFRAGTIGTVAEKTAFGFVKGYLEEKGLIKRQAEIERLAMGCTGVKRSTGQHPGGIVVIPDYMEIYDFTPYQFPADDINSPWRTTHFDYHPMEEEILKLDILGHDDPTTLRMLQDLSGINILSIKPFDDPKVLSILSSPEVLGVTPEEINCPTGTLGVPELGTRFVIQMLEDTKPKTFGGLVKISGLSHGTDVWLGNAQEFIKNGTVPFEEVIGCRDDIMVTLINLGIEPIKAFKIMEFVRKGMPSKLPEVWEEHAAVLKAGNIPDWYIESCRRIKYMFPKAHAVAYVMSALRIAWFKVYHPIIYYCAYFSVRCNAFEVETLIKGKEGIRNRITELEAKGFELTNKEGDVLEVLRVCLEMTARGFNFKNIDLKNSAGKNFVIDEDNQSLIIPFRALDGLGDSVASTIVSARNDGAFISIEDFGNRGKVNTTSIDKMRSLGVFESLPESSQLSLF